MKSKELLHAHFHGQIFAGWKFEEICQKVLSGKIKPKKSYIQTFDEADFWQIEPSVIFLTELGEKCFLYEVD